MPTLENAAVFLPLIARARAVAAMDGRDAGEQWLRAATHGSERALRLYAKAAVPVSSTIDSDLDIAAMVGEYTATLRTTSAAVRLIVDGFIKPVPFLQKLLLVTTAPTAAARQEGYPGPLSRVVFGGEIVEPRTAMSIIAATREMVRALGAAAETLFNREVGFALGARLDFLFFETLVGDDTGAPVITSSGDAAVDCLHDLRSMLLQTNALGTPRLAFVMGTEAIKRAVTLGSADGVPIFPDLSPSGGSMLKVPTMVSSGIAADEIYLIEGSCVGANIGAIDLNPGLHADLEMSDAPVHNAITPTPTTLVSAWQNNLVPYRGTVVYGATCLKDNAIIRLENVNWGG